MRLRARRGNRCEFALVPTPCCNQTDEAEPADASAQKHVPATKTVYRGQTEAVIKKANASPTEEGAAERSGGQDGAEIDNRSGNQARRGANVSRRRGEGGFGPGTPAAPPRPGSDFKNGTSDKSHHSNRLCIADRKNPNTATE